MSSARDLRSERRLVVVDDHPLLTLGLSGLMSDRGWQVSAELTQVEQLEGSVVAHQPQIVITDILMPGPDVFDVLEALRRRECVFRVLVLSAHLSDANISRALRARVDGIVAKADGLDELMLAVESLVRGRRYFSNSLRERLVENSFEDVMPKGQVQPLTSRELEVLRLLGSGKGIRDVARQLSIAVKTVDRHRTNIMAKLEIHSQVELVRYAIREKIVEI